MPMTHFIHLDDRSLLCFKGNDVHKLLQGLITNSMDRLHHEGTIYSALLSPQGKYLYDFFLKQVGDAVYCDIASTDAESLIKKLSMYRLRADVTFEILPHMHVLSHPEYVTLEGAIHFKDPRSPQMGGRYFVSTLPQHVDTSDAYHSRRIMYGIAEGAYDAIKDNTLLLEMGYDALHAIDFHKGCYVGQEVTARSKYRANIRRRIYRIEADSAFEDNVTDVIADDVTLGDRRSFSGSHALALLHSEKLQDAINAGHDIYCGSVKVHVCL
jgi:tRNA-modifying protein YgfZ